MIEFNDLVARLSAGRMLSNFGPNFKDPITVKVWYKKLRHLNSDDLNAALNKLTGNREFPTVNEIIKFCEELNLTTDMLPEVAFQLVWSKISSVGYYGTPELPNEVGLAVQRLGGWKHICNTWQLSKRDWHYKAFREVYGNVVDTKSRGMLSETSVYAPEALKGEKVKQIQPGAKEALRIAMAAPQSAKQKLNNFIKEMKRKQDVD
jgi:hypothetical protein